MKKEVVTQVTVDMLLGLLSDLSKRGYGDMKIVVGSSESPLMTDEIALDLYFRTMELKQSYYDEKLVKETKKALKTSLMDLIDSL